MVTIAAATTVAVAQNRGGTAAPAAGPASSASPRTTDPHLSPILDAAAPAFDCIGSPTLHAATARVATIGITSNRFCLTVFPQSHQVAGTDLKSAGPLRAMLVAETTAGGAVGSSVDGVQWIPQGSTASSGTAVVLYRLGSLRGFAFPISSAGTLVLYSGQTVVTRQSVLSPVVGGGPVAASSSPAPGALGPPDSPAVGATDGTAPAQRSYPPGQGPSAKPGAWPTNARGQTYGTAGGANARTGEPDLIAAVATNGKEGYVLRTDLETPLPTSRSEAVTYHPAPRTIPVYRSDGVTQIGVFVVGG